MNNFYTAYHTDVGIKKKTNQDSLLLKGISTEKGEILFSALCDGMGGMAKGELASATVIRALDDWFQRVYTQKGIGWELDDVQEQWEKLLEDSNRKLLEYGRKQQVQLGTTVTAILILPERRYLIGHVGDTRIYKITNKVEQLTEDHTFIARELKRGTMTIEQAAADTRKNILLQCIGANEQFAPQFLTGKFSSDEGILICSDGFRHVVSEEELYEYLTDVCAVEEAGMKKQLVKLVELNKQRNETDNISAMFIKLR